jgi:pilus assembly protein TadC
MTLKLLKANIAREKEIILEIKNFFDKLESMKVSQDRDKGREMLIESSINSLIVQLKIINNSIPALLEGITGKTKEKILQVKYQDAENKKSSVFVEEKNKKIFLKAVDAEKSAKPKIIESTKNEKLTLNKENSDYYILLSNKFFKQTSENLIKKGYFSSLNYDLRKITAPYILKSYVSMLFLTTSIAFLLGILSAVIIWFLFSSLIVSFVVFLLLPILAFSLMYGYPSSQVRSLQKSIDQELPFVAIYLSAIATSGIEPSKIFNILERTEDYPATRREIKKLLNYINFYGFDLVSALKICSRNCPSEKLSQLFNGFSSTITSGGELSDFLSKHADTLLFDYRLEREKYTKAAETLMNIYISVVIAAPMILMMVMILISMTDAGGAITPNLLTIMTIGFVAIVNAFFIIILNSKQPKF